MKLKEYKENPFAFPGGYQLNAIMGDGERMCHTCVTTEDQVFEGENEPFYNEDKDWQFLGVEIYWEGPPIQCANCNKELRSEYGDPDEPENEGSKE